MSAVKLPWQAALDDALAGLEARGRRRSLRTILPLANHRARIEGHEYLNLAANDYLGLGCDPSLVSQFLDQFTQDEPRLTPPWFSASASRLLGGEHAGLAEVEDRLAQAYGAGRQTLLFNSGYHANIGILPALTGRDDLVLSDRLVHASLVDGIRLCRSQWTRYRHNDLDQLEQLLSQSASRHRRVFVVTESVFSMDGDTADLRQLAVLKQKYGAILYVDEAHAVGVRGRGLGLAAELGVDQEIDILIGTFGKALAACGAWAVLAPPLRDYLINTCRSLIYTTALPPINAAWLVFILERALQADDRRQALAQRVELFRRALGVRAGTQIVPFTVGDDRVAVELSRRLREHGFWVPPIRPPTVPEGTAQVALLVGCGHGHAATSAAGGRGAAGTGVVVKYEWTQDEGRPAVVLFFAGWAMDARPWRELQSQFCDVCVCFDYRSLPGADTDPDTSDWLLGRSPDAWSRAGQVTVVAWSFGCAVAAQAMLAASWTAHTALAINGTVVPEDDHLGIPSALLSATAENLNAAGWSRFVRRMCRGSEARSHFERHSPAGPGWSGSRIGCAAQPGSAHPLRVYPGRRGDGGPDHRSRKPAACVAAVCSTGSNDGRAPLSFLSLADLGRAAWGSRTRPGQQGTTQTRWTCT